MTLSVFRRGMALNASVIPALLLSAGCSQEPATLRPGGYELRLASGPPGLTADDTKNIGRTLCLLPGGERDFPDKVARAFVMINPAGTMISQARDGNKFHGRARWPMNPRVMPGGVTDLSYEGKMSPDRVDFVVRLDHHFPRAAMDALPAWRQDMLRGGAADFDADPLTLFAERTRDGCNRNNIW
jgi:hypothetical protein